MTNSVRVAFSLSTVLLAISLVTPAAQAETCGQLAGVRGSGVEILRVQRGRANQEAVRYAMKVTEKSVTPIECDDVILAGKDSSARILLANAKLSLGSETRIEIASHQPGAKGAEASVSLLNLTYGKLRALVNRKANTDIPVPQTTNKPASGAEAAAGQSAGREASTSRSKSVTKSAPKISFEVRTFSAVAGVRGTDFFVSYNSNSGITDQATIEGAVEVAQAGTSQTALVEGGKQVTIETTPQAVKAAQERNESSKAGSKNAKANEPPKTLPVSEIVKPLVVVSIKESLKEDLRRTSAAVSDDPDFSSKKAVETIGAPSTWTVQREAVPENLKNLKNEY